MSLFHSKEHGSDLNQNQHHRGDIAAKVDIIDNRSAYNKNALVGPPLPVEHWVDDHLMLCVNPRYSNYIHTEYDDQIAIPMNTVFPFESKLFKGRAIIRCVDLPSTDKVYFKGRARKMDITFQVIHRCEFAVFINFKIQPLSARSQSIEI